MKFDLYPPSDTESKKQSDEAQYLHFAGVSHLHDNIILLSEPEPAWLAEIKDLPETAAKTAAELDVCGTDEIKRDPGKGRLKIDGSALDPAFCMFNSLAGKATAAERRRLSDADVGEVSKSPVAETREVFCEVAGFRGAIDGPLHIEFKGNAFFSKALAYHVDLVYGAK